MCVTLQALSDAQLFGVLGVLVLINMIVLVTWWVVDPRSVQITAVTTILVSS